MAIHAEINPDPRTAGTRVALEALGLARRAMTANPGTVSIPNGDGSHTVIGPGAGTDETGRPNGINPWAGDTVAPGRPTGVTATSKSGVLIASWDGTLEGGVPADFSFIEAECRRSGDPAVPLGRLKAAGSLTSGALWAGSEYAVTAVAVDAQGNRSAASDPVAVTIDDPMGDAAADLEEAKKAAEEAKKAADAVAGKADAAQKAADEASKKADQLSKDVDAKTEEAKKAAEDASEKADQTAKDAQDKIDGVKKDQQGLLDRITEVDKGSVKESFEEYAVGDSRVVAPAGGWSRTPPEAGPGQCVWRRPVTVTGDGMRVTGEPVPLTGDSAPDVAIASSEGLLFRNSAGSTVLTASVLYGAFRIETLSDLRRFFGAGAAIRWRELSYGGEWADVADGDPRLSEDGMSMTVRASEVDVQATFAADLVAG